MGQFWSELKRRNVVRVAGMYILASWVILQVLDTVGDFLGLPLSAGRAAIYVLLLGFPVAMYLAWAYTITPEGVKRHHSSHKAKPVGRVDYLVVFALIIALGAGIYQVYQKKDLLIAEPEIASQSSSQPGQGRTTEAAENSIAVLPFVNMSSDPEQEYFSDGITEEILNVLSKLQGLQVTSRTSSFAFKGKNSSIPEIAASLGVAYVLEGSIRKAGNRVRITAQLIHVESDSHYFSDTWEREMDDVFAIQDEISAKIGEQLQLQLSSTPSVTPQSLSQQNLSSELLDKYLRATQLMAATTYSNAQQAQELLRNVIDMAPGFSRARSRLANVYLSMVQIGTMHPEEAIGNALPLADKALELEPSNAEALTALSYIYRSRGDLEGSDRLLEQALALEPGNAAALLQAISNITYGREFEEKDELAERLLRIDPLSDPTLIILQDYYRRAGNRPEAQRIMERMSQLEDKELMYSVLMAVNEYYDGGPETRLEYFQRAYDVEPRFGGTAAQVTMTLLDTGQIEEALNMLNTTPALREDPLQIGRAEMFYRLYTGENSQAFAIARELQQPDLPDRYAAKAHALRVSLLEAMHLKQGYSSLAQRYLEIFPELAEFKVPNSGHLPPILIKYGHFMVANDLALLYGLSGEDDKARQMNQEIEKTLSQWPRSSVLGSGIADVELFARTGQIEKALTALNEAVEENWHRFWWFHLDHSPHLDSIREEPVFIELRKRFAKFEGEG